MSALSILRWMLRPLGSVYGAVARFRARLYASGVLEQKRLDAAVVSVGNLTVGGTGKTPMVMWLAEKFLAQGKRVAVLSRGYRGADGLSDEVTMMMARFRGRVQFGVGKDRYTQGLQLEERGVELFLLDDGFQHLQLARDVDIVLVDCTHPLHHERMLPGGRLREPVSAMNRANLVVFTRMDSDPVLREVFPRLGNLPVYPASTRLAGFRSLGALFPGDDLQSAEQIGAGPFFAFCGIGNPEAFAGDLLRWGLPLAGRKVFRDHHRYKRGDVRRIESAAKAAGAAALVTTEKDVCNLPKPAPFTLPVHAAVIDLQVEREGEFLAAIEARLAARSGKKT